MPDNQRRMFKTVTAKDGFFFLVLIAIQTIILHGKFIAMVLFGRADLSAFADPGPVIHGTIIIGAIWFFFLKIGKAESEWKIFLGALMGIGMLIVMSIVRQAIIISVLTIFCYIVATVVVFIDDYFEREMEIEFWKVLFDAGIKGIQFSLVLFGIGMALLRVLVDSKNEDTWGFLTTFFSATVAIVATVYLLVNWVLLPCWRKLVAGYSRKPERF